MLSISGEIDKSNIIGNVSVITGNRSRSSSLSIFSNSNRSFTEQTNQEKQSILSNRKCNNEQKLHNNYENLTLSNNKKKYIKKEEFVSLAAAFERMKKPVQDQQHELR